MRGAPRTVAGGHFLPATFSPSLLQTLIKHGLIDQYNLMIFPVVLGKGKRLFGDDAISSGLR